MIGLPIIGRFSMTNEIGMIEDSQYRSFDELPPERQERLKTIIELKRREITNDAIAKLVRVGVATIYRDNALLKQLSISRATTLNMAEEFGSVLNFLDEVIDKAMEGYRSALNDNEQTVYQEDRDGKKVPVTRSVPDHAHANRYLLTAMAAQKQKLDSLLNVTTTNSVNKFIDSKTENNKLRPVAELKTAEDFKEAETAIKKQLSEHTRKLHILRGPCRSDYYDDDEYEKDRAIHMKKLDDFIEIQKEFEKPWPRRKQRNQIDKK